MRVNIAYSVDIENIPQEVLHLLPSTAGIEIVADTITDVISKEKNIEKAIEQINDLRKEMYSIDQRFADCQAILEGYIKAKFAPPPSAPSPESMQQLAEMLKQQKEELDGESSEG